MAFSEIGFLSPSLADWSKAARSQFKDWFDLVDGLNKEAVKLLPAIEPDRTKTPEIVVALLYRRALQSFEGLMLMAERGMVADALALGRSCAETAIAIGGVLTDAKFIELLIEDDAKRRLTYANVILFDNELRGELSSEWVANLQRVVSTAKSKYPAPGPRAIKWAQVAKDAKMSALYDMLYRTISGGASHVTLNALDRHVESNSAGPIGSLTFRPETRELTFCLSIGACALLHAMEALTRMFPKEAPKQAVQSCADAWAALESQNNRQETSANLSKETPWTSLFG
jgi:hypothetical protein